MGMGWTCLKMNRVRKMPVINFIIMYLFLHACLCVSVCVKAYMCKHRSGFDKAISLPITLNKCETNIVVDECTHIFLNGKVRCLKTTM